MPFSVFAATNDPALNFAGIGVVIGHENSVRPCHQHISLFVLRCAGTASVLTVSRCYHVAFRMVVLLSICVRFIPFSLGF